MILTNNKFLVHDLLTGNLICTNEIQLKRVGTMLESVHAIAQAYANYKEMLMYNQCTNNWLKMHNQPMRRNRALN